LRPTFALALAAGLILAQPVLAQAPPGVRVQGVVTAVDNGGLTVRAADGTKTKLGLAPDLSLVTTRQVDIDTIQPGDFIATANLEQPDGSGRSIELRVFEKGSHAGEGSRPMAQPGQIMTNATVSKVAKTAEGREFEVTYPGGARRIVVPASIPVIQSVPVDPAALKPGATVSLLAQRAPDGSLRAGRITVDPKDVAQAR
jgi:hypothetical protein